LIDIESTHDTPLPVSSSFPNPPSDDTDHLIDLPPFIPDEFGLSWELEEFARRTDGVDDEGGLFE
jgi:hypothetical protein